MSTRVSVSAEVQSGKDNNAGNDAVFLNRTLWQPWFSSIQDMLDRLELPSQWRMVVMYLTILEGHNGFQNGTMNLSPAGRPPDVQNWIHCRRRAVPHKHMKDLTTTHSNWWSYWKSLQPGWIVSVIAGLGFWGFLAKGGMRRQKDLWDDTVEDVKWVLQKMLGL
ncbi:hypothetical protein EDD85DRAFT_792903 [Armillaria nabsnona]|nr:hypothetical protein EDD85DRAFT_792903 [Armillaria nabsnona]